MVGGLKQCSIYKEHYLALWGEGVILQHSLSHRAVHWNKKAGQRVPRGTKEKSFPILGYKVTAELFGSHLQG